MIRAIVETWEKAPLPAWPGAQERRGRRRRPAILTREHVSIAPEAAEMAAFAGGSFDPDPLDGSDAADPAGVALAIAAYPGAALAAQARLGAGVVRHLITVNAVNRV